MDGAIRGSDPNRGHGDPLYERPKAPPWLNSGGYLKVSMAGHPTADAHRTVYVHRAALYDAIGQGIAEFGEELAAMDEDERPGHVIVVVQTDGDENSSRDSRPRPV